jgi:hypothetical protein
MSSLQIRGIAIAAGIAMAGVGFAAPASAGAILVFGQKTFSPDFVLTQTSSSTTNMSVSSIITVTTFDSSSPVTPFDALFTLTASNTSPATLVGNQIFESFTGSFTITSASCGAGGNCLSGTFIDGFGGKLNGSSATLSASTPSSNAVTFTSDIIPMSELGLERALSFSLAGVSPFLTMSGTTIASTTAQFSGVFSANPQAVPEPGSLALLGAGVLGLGFVGSRRKQAS